MRKRVLITQQELANYGGSEVVTLELTDYFLARGFDVVIATSYYGQPISEEFDKRVKVVDFNSKIDMDSFSHLWIHHNLIPWQILTQIGSGVDIGAKIAFHHMSPYLPVESPLIPRLEESVADYIFFNSEETRGAYVDLFGNTDKLKVFGNPAPDKFYCKPDSSDQPKELKNILVVSNHIPTELLEAIEILKRRELNVDIFGISGKPKLITSDILSQYDVVVSIGKTVQYSIVNGTPLYCYDHFGGSGYLAESNFSKNRFYNFSGRGFRKKKPEAIVEEMLKKYPKAKEDARKIQDKYGREFLLSNALSDFIDDNIKKKKTSGLEDEVARQKVFTKMNINSIQSIVYLRNELSSTRAALSVKEKENKELRLTNEKLSKALLMRSPARLAKKAAKKLQKKIRDTL